MGIEFDWQITEEDGDETEQKYWSTPPWMRWTALLLVMLVFGSVLGGFWWRLNSAETALRNTIQSVVDLQQQAYADGDGELFLSTFDSEDIAYRYQQLRPDAQAARQLVQTVTQAETHDGIIWANIEQSTGTGTVQRIAFFRESESGLQQIASDPNYWGSAWGVGADWGSLRTYDADSQWQELFTQTIGDALGDASPRNFSVLIRPDFDVSIRPNTVYFPSPRLVSLDSEGMPSAAYLAALKDAVRSQVAPVTLQFALPNHTEIDGITARLKLYAADFAKQFPNQQVEIEFLTAEDLSPDAPEAWLQTVDGALFQPTEALIRQGHVFDITQLVSDDAAFDRGDFYVQAWRGAWYEDRMWMVPWTTSFNLFYYNQDMFKASGTPFPQADWTWEQVQEILPELLLELPSDRPIIDPTRDLLYAYAYSIMPPCQTQNCVTPLSPFTASEALTWYLDLVGEKQVVTDLATLDPINRSETILGTLSANKQVAMWVDDPINYEYQLGLQKTGVLPMLDFSAEIPLTAPIHVNGHIMSSHTDQPYLTWQWLKFLSYQTAPSRQRHIPARPSVTRQDPFLQKLPEPIADAYQTIIGSARPILIGEENYFTWSQLSQVIKANDVTPQLAQPTQTNWFLKP